MAGIQLQAPYPVPSVVSFHPDIPNDVADRLVLNNGIAQGATITLATINDAELALRGLEIIKHREPAITQEVISTTKNRAHVLRSIASQSTFPNPVDLTAIRAQLNHIEETLREVQDTQRDMQDTLREVQNTQRDMQATQRDMQATQRELRDSIRRVDAKQDNARIIFINASLRQHEGTTSYNMLKKVVSGDGLQLATAVAPNNHAVPNVPLGEVGDPYDQNQVETSGLSHADILAIIRFYNESFGIVADDNRADRIRKIANALTGAGPF